MSQRTVLLVVFSILLAGSLVIFFTHRHTSSTNQNTNSFVNTNAPVVNVNAVSNTNTAPTNSSTKTPVVSEAVVPIGGFFSRVTKKPFGRYITPKTSPIQPEKFTGYHTGADAETTTAEKNVDIPIYSIATGTVVFAGHVNGYGGVMMIRYTFGQEIVTALYGHLRISSFKFKVGQSAPQGKEIAVLGTGASSETDGERKHLHFGIIKGATINYKGYVAAKSGLSAWDDPVAWLRSHGAQ